MTTSPFPYSSLELPNEEIIKQEIVTYVNRNGSVLKITVKRNFTGVDYVDNMTTEVLLAND